MAQSGSATVRLTTVLANYGSVPGPSHQELLGPAIEPSLAILSCGSTPKKGNKQGLWCYRTHCPCFVLISQRVSANLYSPSLAQAHHSCFVLVSQWVGADLHSPFLAQAHCSCFVLISQWVSASLYSPSLA